MFRSCRLLQSICLFNNAFHCLRVCWLGRYLFCASGADIQWLGRAHRCRAWSAELEERDEGSIVDERDRSSVTQPRRQWRACEDDGESEVSGTSEACCRHNESNWSFCGFLETRIL